MQRGSRIYAREQEAFERAAGLRDFRRETRQTPRPCADIVCSGRAAGVRGRDRTLDQPGGQQVDQLP